MYPFQILGYSIGPSFALFAGVGLVIFLLWNLVWKAFALWRAALRREPWWFIIFLFVNTGGILEIIYLFVVTKEGVPNLFDSSTKGNQTS
jgi:hypothetical protein